ncbi:SH3 domain-containing protein [Phototrophicus methaneseepsis]|nr:SH3 domain-containing protein [Phototrophicus methaneseepsis]
MTFAMAFSLAACSTGLPQVTPTLAPTSTPTPETTQISQQATRTPIRIFTETATPTLAPPSATVTSGLTETTTATPTTTGTSTPSSTPTITATATASLTPTFTIQPSLTAIPTETLAPSPTDLIFATSTTTQTPVNTATPSPTATLTPNFAATVTRESELLSTLSAEVTPSPLPTWTPLPLPTATNTVVIVPPTLDITPTFITATPGGDLGLIDPPTAIPGSPEPQQDAPTATVTPFTPTALPPEQVPNLVIRSTQTSFDPEFTTVNTDAFQFSVGDGAFIFNGQGFPGGVSLFAPNPIDPNSYARTNSAGMLLFRAPGSNGEGQITGAPFYDGFQANAAESNKNFVAHLAWSPDGQKLAFVIVPPPGTDNQNAGVWFWQPQMTDFGQSFAVLHDCPENGYTSCDLADQHPVEHWQSETVYWSPDSNRMLINVFIRSEGRGGIAVVDASMDPDYAKSAAGIWRYDSGIWLDDDNILVSGRRPSDGHVILGIVDTNFQDVGQETILFDGSAANIWIQDAVPVGNNTYLALGKPGAPDGPLQLYRIANGQATSISGNIGDAYPERIHWASNYSAVVVTVHGVQYQVDANSGAISVPNVTGTVEIGGSAGANANQDAGGIAPIGVREGDEAPATEGDIPQGVIEGSRYQPGQTVQFVGDTVRNLRDVPSTENSTVIDLVAPYEFVAILAGPFQAEGFGWWQVSNARNFRGWIAADFDGGSLFVP